MSLKYEPASEAQTASARLASLEQAVTLQVTLDLDFATIPEGSGAHTDFLALV